MISNSYSIDTVKEILKICGINIDSFWDVIIYIYVILVINMLKKRWNQNGVINMFLSIPRCDYNFGVHPQRVNAEMVNATSSST